MEKVNLKNIWYFMQGNMRYKLYYTRLKCMIPRYIREQIDARIKSMNRECYNQGSCIKCGCTTTQLQMANKTCNADCYPPMMSIEQWRRMKDNKMIVSPAQASVWMLKNGKFKRYNYGIDNMGEDFTKSGQD